jgi:hypothetical protein
MAMKIDVKKGYPMQEDCIREKSTRVYASGLKKNIT